METYRLSILLIIFSLFIFSLTIRPANGQGNDFELQSIDNDDSDERPAEEDNEVKQNNEARKRNLYWLTFSVPHNDSGTGISERDVSFLVELSGPERVITQQDSVPRHPASLSAQERRIITDPANQPCCSHDIVQETPHQPVSTAVVITDPTKSGVQTRVVQTYSGYTSKETSESEHHPVPIRMSRESIDIFIMIARSLRGHVHQLIDQRTCLQDLLQLTLICGNYRRDHHFSVCCTCCCGMSGAAIPLCALNKHTVSAAAKASIASASVAFCCLLGCLTVVSCHKYFNFKPVKLLISIKHAAPLYEELPETGIREDVQESLRRLISSFDRIGSTPALISLNSTTHSDRVVVTDLVIEITTPVDPRWSRPEFLEYYRLSGIMDNPNIRIGNSFNDLVLLNLGFQSL